MRHFLGFSNTVIFFSMDPFLEEDFLKHSSSLVESQNCVFASFATLFPTLFLVYIVYTTIRISLDPLQFQFGPRKFLFLATQAGIVL